MASNYEIDNLDKEILSILMKDGKTPYTEIGKKLFVSGGTVHVRIKKMEEAGIILGNRMNVDYSKIGYDIICFVGIFLKESIFYDNVNTRLAELDEVVEVHYTTGVYSLFIKIVLRDRQHLMEMLHDKIQNIDGIQRTETLISLNESVQRPLEIVKKEDWYSVAEFPFFS